jgi:hypothetical protein
MGFQSGMRAIVGRPFDAGLGGVRGMDELVREWNEEVQ